ncbi:hypothetical protein BCR34DRAFT_577664 [Clohesyomyces aquaticus]|uniref:Uncharacterized protein n=1 Tax=Clohesyomyces aquaticus TaxID=1231657 RepID=A0A1Y1YIS6_9PLEO|nr:hypothetical protein BCR34DRAFT_577664 [Clohesyomyces aquaticus]
MGPFLLTSSILLPTLLTATLFSTLLPWTEFRSHTIAISDTIPLSFRTSHSVSKTVNPRAHVSIDDTRSIVLTLRNASVADEEILAQFVKGFFGGWVFAFERNLLGLLSGDIVRYPDLPKPSSPNRIQTASSLPSTTLPPLHTILFHAFQVIDLQLSTSPSYVDFAFGSSLTSFAGVHRFSISRLGDDSKTIELAFEHTSCNPNVNRPLPGGWVLFSLHKFYAMVLYREGVAGVMRTLC